MAKRTTKKGSGLQSSFSFKTTATARKAYDRQAKADGASSTGAWARTTLAAALTPASSPGMDKVVHQVGLEQFAHQVLEVARTAPASERFGDHKVWLSYVRMQLIGAAPVEGGDQRLIEAHRTGLLTLGRADMPIDTQRERASELTWGHARFNFVDLEQSAKRQGAGSRG